MNRIAVVALSAFAFAGAAHAAKSDPRIAACQRSKFKGEFRCSQAHVNPRSWQVGTCGKASVVSISQSGVAGTVLEKQLELTRVPTAHPGMSATFKGKSFQLWVNMTDPDSKGLFPSELTENGKNQKLKCARIGPGPTSAP